MMTGLVQTSSDGCAPGFVGICGAIGWLLIAKKPIANLMVFKNRNYSIGCMRIAAASAIVYASAVAVPQFAQQVLPYTGPGLCCRRAGLR
jgi:hypothetical protein